MIYLILFYLIVRAFGENHDFVTRHLYSLDTNRVLSYNNSLRDPSIRNSFYKSLQLCRDSALEFAWSVVLVLQSLLLLKEFVWGFAQNHNKQKTCKKNRYQFFHSMNDKEFLVNFQKGNLNTKGCNQLIHFFRMRHNKWNQIRPHDLSNSLYSDQLCGDVEVLSVVGKHLHQYWLLL